MVSILRSEENIVIFLQTVDIYTMPDWMTDNSRRKVDQIPLLADSSQCRELWKIFFVLDPSLGELHR